MKRIGILCLLAACTQLMAAEASYTVDARIALSGEGGWDDLIVDGKAQRLYVAREIGCSAEFFFVTCRRPRWRKERLH